MPTASSAKAALPTPQPCKGRGRASLSQMADPRLPEHRVQSGCLQGAELGPGLALYPLVPAAPPSPAWQLSLLTHSPSVSWLQPPGAPAWSLPRGGSHLDSPGGVSRGLYFIFAQHFLSNSLLGPGEGQESHGGPGAYGRSERRPGEGQY